MGAAGRRPDPTRPDRPTACGRQVRSMAVVDGREIRHRSTQSVERSGGESTAGQALTDSERSDIKTAHRAAMRRASQESTDARSVGRSVGRSRPVVRLTVRPSVLRSVRRTSACQFVRWRSFLSVGLSSTLPRAAGRASIVLGRRRRQRRRKLTCWTTDGQTTNSLVKGANRTVFVSAAAFRCPH